jgi:hypothetical protein
VSFEHRPAGNCYKNNGSKYERKQESSACRHCNVLKMSFVIASQVDIIGPYATEVSEPQTLSAGSADLRFSLPNEIQSAQLVPEIIAFFGPLTGSHRTIASSILRQKSKPNGTEARGWNLRSQTAFTLAAPSWPRRTSFLDLQLRAGGK